MNFSLSKKKSTGDGKNLIADSHGGGMNGFVAQFYVFHGEKYLGWDCFDTPHVRVGKSPSADLVLNDESMDDIQAEFLIQGSKVTVVDKGKKGILTVNNQAVSHCAVGALDVVKIGTYTIKIKVKGIEAVSVKAQQPLPEKALSMDRPTAIMGSESLDRLSNELKSVMDEDELDSVDLEDILDCESDKTFEEECDLAIDMSLLFDDTEDVTEMIALSDLTVEDDVEVDVVPARPVKTPIKNHKEEVHILEKAPQAEISWDEFSREIPVETKTHEEITQKPTLAKAPKKKRPSPAPEVAPLLKKQVESEIKNTFPPSFFKVIDDEEDKDEEDFPASFSLRDKLIGNDRNLGRTSRGEKVLEIITFRGDSVLNITHLKGKEDHVLIDDHKDFCRVSHDEKQGPRLFFSEPLLGTINRSEGKEFKAEKQFSTKGLLSRQKTFSSSLPTKGELILSDGFYDYALRHSFLNDAPLFKEHRKDDLPLPKRVVKSTAFKYASRAVGFHIILMIILSYSITMPDKTEFKDPETYFVMVETENIHKPVKPKPKPKPPAPIPQKVEKAVKVEPRPSTQVAELRPKKNPTKSKKAEPPKAGGGHKGTVVNRNVNDMGLLATLGMKTGIEIKPNDALASVTNMDAITSSHASEARIKVGGLVGDLGDSRMAIPSGGVINNKGAADVLRSAGIGGKGTVAALQNGNTGNREVSGAVTAPLTKKVKFKGGGISREAVAKVINDHIDEINYCYETALISDPTLMGKIEFEWVILLSGEVGEVRIKSSSVRSNEIHSCIKSAIRTWTFPKPKGSAVEVSYPFVFDVSGF
ncbi:MAG: AgmX/PglI C-terminal domain-containing protein [Proteobacteria bacterium]|nr:AgmX/PglI C-terminal domain-containing protein [Pseudomonadota bacterium]